MAPLRDTRRERFCQLLVEGQSASAAYVSAGFKPSGPNAGRLRNKPEVAARIAELQAEVGAEHRISVASICKELDEAVAVAKAKGQANPMVSAAGLRAKLAGLMVDKQQVEINDARGAFDDCHSYPEIARQWATHELDSMTNSRWRQIDEADYGYLAELMVQFLTEVDRFKRSVEARPHCDEKHPIITIAPSPK
jgi:phage terminase small subunit